MTKTNQERRAYAAGHYYMVPNAVFVLKLTPGELAVYNYLLYKEDRKTFEYIASYREIGAAIHSSKNSVKKYVHLLEDKELISTEHTFINRRSDGAKRNGCLRYHINSINHALKLHYERQLLEAEKAAEQERVRRLMDELNQRKAG